MIAQGREGNWKDVERELPELREWIGKTPSLFLHELKRRNVVTEEEYWKAFTIPLAAKRADSILLHVMIRGEGKRRKLLETLEQQQSRERHFLDMLKTSPQSFKNLNVDESREDIPICHHFANSGDHRTNNTDAEKGDRKVIRLRTTMEEPSVARELIARIPAMLHHELLVQDLITQSEFSEVYSKPSASDRVKFMISRLNRKKRKKPKLQDILREHREKQEVFPNMRSESSTCSPTLNPNTAHWNLQISADFKTVRTSTHTQPYRDNSDRFDHYQPVICSEKFSLGRHFWKVDVRGCETFIIGVTYGAIPRKGDDDACNIGCNEVSWSLKKRGNDYTAVHNETETKLSVRDAPKRVGVHLDWEAGVLSFYSADSMSLLHRFHGRFDREPYPAMCTPL
ncbi:uncharacterized protein LOC142906625 isoform X1 [Petromyzon marinus]|uniref:uncharacterized protein LOC142906625 isoform X1 n=1 Tax=Petromyzon marinus TaxID=7757 RepID=UPI003F721DFB